MLDRDYLVQQAKEFANTYKSYEGFISYDVEYNREQLKPKVQITEKALKELFPQDVIKTATLKHGGWSQYEVDYKGVKFYAIKNLYEN